MAVTGYPDVSLALADFSFLIRPSLPKELLRLDLLLLAVGTVWRISRRACHHIASMNTAKPANSEQLKTGQQRASAD